MEENGGAWVEEAAERLREFIYAPESLRWIEGGRSELLDDVNDLQGRIEGLEQERARLKVECERLHAMIQRAIHPSA